MRRIIKVQEKWFETRKMWTKEYFEAAADDKFSFNSLDSGFDLCKCFSD